MKSLLPLYRIHTQVFDNALAGVSESIARQRINDRTNHITWMAGNLVNCRYWMADVLGLDQKDPHEQLFAEAKALDSSANYPTLDELKKEWHKISPAVFQRLSTISDEELLKEFDAGMGMDGFFDKNVLNTLGMCIDRESYLLGQVALMRRAVMNESMRYEFDPAIRY